MKSTAYSYAVVLTALRLLQIAITTPQGLWQSIHKYWEKEGDLSFYHLITTCLAPVATAIWDDLLPNKIPSDDYCRMFLSMVPWDTNPDLVFKPEFEVRVRERLRSEANLKFTSYQVQAVLRDKDETQTFLTEADWGTAVREATERGDAFETVWSLYGIDQQGFHRWIGDYKSKQAAEEIKQAIER